MAWIVHHKLILSQPSQQIFSQAGDCVVKGQDHNNRACKYILNFMANIFNLASLAGVSREGHSEDIKMYG